MADVFAGAFANLRLTSYETRREEFSIMSRHYAVISGLLMAAILLSAAPRAAADDKAEIEAIQKRVFTAIQHKDVDGILAEFQRSPSLVIFDVIPPRQYTGWDAWKDDWAGVLKGCANAPKADFTDLQIESSGELAFSRNIGHFSCVDAKGNRTELTWRQTDCYRKQGGKWIIVHEHLSVPADPVSGKAELNAKP